MSQPSAFLLALTPDIATVDRLFEQWACHSQTDGRTLRVYHKRINIIHSQKAESSSTLLTMLLCDCAILHLHLCIHHLFTLAPAAAAANDIRRHL